MKKFNTIKEITDHFIKDGWSKDTSFSELSIQEAEEKGYLFAVNGINKGRKYFKMNANGNIYDDNGEIAMFNIPAIGQ